MPPRVAYIEDEVDDNHQGHEPEHTASPFDGHTTFQQDYPPTPAPAPAGVDPAVWANSQALVLSLSQHLRSLALAQHTPPQPEEADINIQAPTKFSGNTPAKLRDFLYECRLVFRAKPFTYSTDEARIIYAIQHLTGIAKRHFRRDIEQGCQSEKVSSWASFTQELEATFGDPYRVWRASQKILSLKMTENQRVHRYTVSFKEYADELDWPDPVLHTIYYHGLPDRIKDLWTYNDPPASFQLLVSKAQQFDRRYWMDEKKKATTTT